MTKRYETWGTRKVLLIKCCGHDLACPNFTNTCGTCGADYNSAGSKLAPRSQWGEETGEHWSECIGPFDPDTALDGGL